MSAGISEQDRSLLSPCVAWGKCSMPYSTSFVHVGPMPSKETLFEENEEWTKNKINIKQRQTIVSVQIALPLPSHSHTHPHQPTPTHPHSHSHAPYSARVSVQEPTVTMAPGICPTCFMITYIFPETWYSFHKLQNKHRHETHACLCVLQTSGLLSVLVSSIPMTQ